MSGWLVTGARGMLGVEVTNVLRDKGVRFTGLTHADLDVADADAVAAKLDRHQPDVVVNCAAWTAVDDAEAREDAAARVNGDGPANLARACARSGTRLLHVSTDYVFAGDADTPYAEDAPTGPRSAYGRTKLAGERAVRDLHPGGGYVVRTAWVYGAHGGNFVATMLRLEGERPTVDVVTDQRGQPTWALDIADRLVRLGHSGAPAGVYHATNGGSASWYDLAREVFTLAGADADRVRPTTSEAFRRPAPRPAYSVLASTAAERHGLPPMRHWRDALAAAVPEMLVAT
ncbi:MAG: dTDP-4-dehydrorhamnose reductase [Streptosporangiales bacterium]|nr:dTDP-4-dehydrorhamnose reductase [Streptosporangiales bacterium]MBO0890373.1 dTDP-4-dehydrorhamnose reductase [Acidothermales bacterium]